MCRSDQTSAKGVVEGNATVFDSNSLQDARSPMTSQRQRSSLGEDPRLKGEDARRSTALLEIAAKILQKVKKRKCMRHVSSPQKGT